MKNEITDKITLEHRLSFIKEGVRLEIVATEIKKDEWSLAVVNEMGVASNWLDYFESKEYAFKAALNAISEEGLHPFLDIEGFEYLQDDYPDV